MSQIIIPDSIASQLPMEAVRRAFASLGLVLDGGAVVGAELGTQRAWQARWASDAIHDQRCAALSRSVPHERCVSGFYSRDGDEICKAETGSHGDGHYPSDRKGNA